MQITIYLNDELVNELDQRARKHRISRSRCVQELLRDGLRDGKPEGALSAFGKINDLDPNLRRHLGPDIAREHLT